MAVERGKAEFVAALIKHGAIIDQNSINFAHINNNHKILEILQAGLLIDVLYNRIPDLKENYANETVIKLYLD